MKNLNQKIISIISLIVLFGTTVAPTHSDANPDPIPQTLYRTFEAGAHPKANGAKVSVQYPADWSTHEGLTPDAIQHFYAPMSLRKYLTLSLLMESNQSGSNIEASCASMSKQDWANLSSGNGMQMQGARTLRHQGKPAFMVVAEKSTMFEGKPIYSIAQMLLICTGSHLVKLSCNASGKSAELAQSLLKEATSLCDRYYGSLVVRR